MRSIISADIYTPTLHDVISNFYCISCAKIVEYIIEKGSTSCWAPKASIAPKDMSLSSVSARSLILDPLHRRTTYHIYINSIRAHMTSDHSRHYNLYSPQVWWRSAEGLLKYGEVPLEVRRPWCDDGMRVFWWSKRVEAPARHSLTRQNLKKYFRQPKISADEKNFSSAVCRRLFWNFFRLGRLREIFVRGLAVGSCSTATWRGWQMMMLNVKSFGSWEEQLIYWSTSLAKE